jgi:hypothetical protein
MIIFPFLCPVKFIEQVEHRELDNNKKIPENQHPSAVEKCPLSECQEKDGQ